MPKINVKITLTTPETITENIYSAIFQPNQNIIIYKEQDATKTKLDMKRLKLRRENDELMMEYLFKPKQSTVGLVEIKSLQKRLELNLTTKEIIQSKNKIEIFYELEKEQYKYKLEVI